MLNHWLAKLFGNSAVIPIARKSHLWIKMPCQSAQIKANWLLIRRLCTRSKPLTWLASIMVRPNTVYTWRSVTKWWRFAPTAILLDKRCRYTSKKKRTVLQDRRFKAILYRSHQSAYRPWRVGNSATINSARLSLHSPKMELFRYKIKMKSP